MRPLGVFKRFSSGNLQVALKSVQIYNDIFIFYISSIAYRDILKAYLMQDLSVYNSFQINEKL